MSELENHLAEVEKYGFDRGYFPMSYHGHTLALLQNDGHETPEGRLLFDFVLYCTDCHTESGLSERFPADDDNQVAHVVNARVAVFHPFLDTECQQKSRNV